MAECIICKLETLGKRRTCSDGCKGKLISQTLKGKTGGVRKGSGRAVSGYYKGIYCGSTYELLWVMYRLSKGLQVERFDGFISVGDKKYFPDFWADGAIVEIKGYHTPEVDAKTKAAEDNGFEIKILYKKDLNVEFDWFKKQYGHVKIKQMYDGYKPKYVYTCSFCGNSFESDNKKRTKESFCNRVCSGKKRSELNSQSEKKGNNQHKKV